MFLTLAIATCLILVLTLVPLWRHPHWTVRIMDFPRVQVGILAAVSLCTQVVFLDFTEISTWVLAVPTVLCLAWQIWWIIPYTPLWWHEVKPTVPGSPSQCIRVMTSNVLGTNRNADALLALVQQHRPDVLVTLESDRWWQEQLDSLLPEMPYAMKCPLENLYGMHVYSRFPLEEARIKFLVEADVPSIHVLVRLPSGAAVRGSFLHPAPPSPTENDESRERDAELMIVARSVKDSREPVIVTGDLNDVAWSATTRLFRKISGLLDPRVGRGMFNTFHADYPLFRWPLDHIFHSRHFTLNAIERLPSIGSDHFPLFVELCLAPEQGADQVGLEAESEDHELAQEKIEEIVAG